MSGGAYETTGYVYGVTVTGGSNVYSNDILGAIQYPDKTTGNPSSSQQVSYTVNALGQNLTMTDRDGNVHTYSFDVLGRQTADAVTTLGTGVDGTVRRIEIAYDTGDRAYLFTAYNAASGGSIVNQVQDAYNGLGQLTEEWQAHSGAVNTNTTPNIQYSYTLMSGNVNNSRLTSMTYPDVHRVITYNYATGVDDRISRLTSITDGPTTLETLSYLGLETVVIRSQPQPGTELTYVKLTGESNGDGGDQYTGLDRFGRIVDQRWIITTTGTALDRTQYGYDRDSNVLFSNNLVNSSFSELYHANGSGNDYDNLNQLTNFARGTLNGSNDTISSPTHSIVYSFDALGNWTSTLTDNTTTQTRTANQQNEITSISGQTTPAYDGNGNMTTDQSGHTLIYDAWNALVQVKNGSTVLESYSYDALNRRITENPGTVRDLYYSMLWQVLEEDTGGSMADQYVWSAVYADALVERDASSTRMYAEQDVDFNITALVDTTGTVQERYIYDPYGAVTILTSAWATRSSSSYSWIYLHQGYRFDNATGLYGERNRDYSPTLGRWLQDDPLGFGGGDSNLYAYETSGPVDGLDWLGLKCPETFKIPWKVQVAIEEAWEKSLYTINTGFFTMEVSQEQGGSIFTSKQGREVKPAIPGDSDSILPENYPQPQEGQTPEGTFHTHSYTKRAGGHLGVSFSGDDIKRFVKEDSGSILYVGAGNCIFILTIDDMKKLRKLNADAIQRTWTKCYDYLRHRTGAVAEAAETAVLRAIANTDICFYKTCNVKGKPGDPIPNTASLVNK